MSNAWSAFVIVLTIITVVGATWLLFSMRTKRVDASKTDSPEHTFDGIQELDSPLPRWWILSFVGTIVFSVLYLALYPGMGNFTGLLGWTSVKQFDAQVANADARYGPVYAALGAKAIPDLAHDETAMRIGARLFANNCARCHGSDARGGPGFPNLTDSDWLYGGEPEKIEASITSGRRGVMPAFAPAVGGQEGVPQVVAYVRSLSGLKADPDQAAAGKAKFMQICSACHGPEGKGNQLVGAPNLTDNIWLYGSRPETIAEGLWKGRSGQMPAHRDILDTNRIHLLAAYVYALSNNNR